MAKQWRRWIHGLVAAVLGGAANALGAVVIEPQSFNFRDQLTSLLGMAGWSAIISLFLYFKTAPPPIYVEENEIAPRQWEDEQPK